MYFLRQSTATNLPIGPAMAAADGVTPVTTLSLSAADQAEITKHNATSTTDISAETMTAITGNDGWYYLALTTGLTDTLGRLTVDIQDASLSTPIFKECMVMPANVWDSFFSTDKLQVDVVEFNSNVAAAVRAALVYGQMVPFTVTNAVVSPTDQLFEASDITEATADHYVPRGILWTTGALAGQYTRILSYALNGSNGQFRTEIMTEAPGNGDTGILI